MQRLRVERILIYYKMARNSEFMNFKMNGGVIKMSKCKLKPTIKKRSRISTGTDEKGMVILSALALISIIAVLATVCVTSTFTEIKLSSNYKTGTQAFYAAQAGTEEARTRLRGSSSDPNYAGDPAANPDPTWSAYILTSSSWQTSDDPDYVDTYTNYIPTTSSHTNTTVATNTLQTTPDISYWVKIRHKREADLFPTEQYTDNGSGTNDIIYYGYATPASTTLEQFTTTNANPTTGSPVEIITSYGSSGTSSDIIEIQTRKYYPGPPIPAAVYGDKEVHLHGSDVNIIGDDACSSGSVPAVTYVGGVKLHDIYTLTSDAGETTQITALDLATHIDELESIATVTLTGNQTNYTVGSSSNYEVVFCDAGIGELELNNVTGYGILAVRGKIKFKNNTNWNGLIIASGEIKFEGDTIGTINGAILSADTPYIKGKVDVYYNSCEIDKATGSIRYDIFRWEDKNLN